MMFWCLYLLISVMILSVTLRNELVREELAKLRDEVPNMFAMYLIMFLIVLFYPIALILSIFKGGRK